MRGACVSARCSSRGEDFAFPRYVPRQRMHIRESCIPRLCGACTSRPFPTNWIVLGSAPGSVNGRAVRVSPLSLESHEPGPQPRASTLHRGGPRTTCYAYTHTHARMGHTRIVSRPSDGPRRWIIAKRASRCRRSRAWLRSSDRFIPYFLLFVLLFILRREFRKVANVCAEEKGKKRGRDCLLGFDFSKRCNLDKKRWISFKDRDWLISFMNIC